LADSPVPRYLSRPPLRTSYERIADGIVRRLRELEPTGAFGERGTIGLAVDATGQAFSKIKNILRKLGGCTHEALLEAMEEALSKVTPADAAGWFEHCGYQVEVQYL
jgi:hypothetical protein